MSDVPAANVPLALVIDDDPSLRTRARFELEAAGLRVIEAGSGEDGLRALELERPSVVILDVQLPGADGFEICRAIRANPGWREVPVLMVTASDDLAAVEQAFESGATDFATKPIHWRLLRHRARFLVRVGRTFDQLHDTLEDLSRHRQRLSDAQRLAHVGNWEWLQPSGRMLWSEEACQLLGYDRREVEPSLERLLAAVHADDRSGVQKCLDDAVASRAGWSVEHRIRLGGDRVRYVQHQGEVDVDPVSGELRVHGTLQDVTERRIAEEKIRKLAYYDSLTGLPNRRLLRQRLEKGFRQATEQKLEVALLFLDIDRFKWVNDSLGHAAGDQLLSQVAVRLVDALRLSDGIFGPPTRDAARQLARIGGDEFVVTLVMRDGAENAAKVAQRILGRLAEPVVVEGRSIVVTGSLGVALYPRDAGDVDELMRCADAAMYQAKRAGKNRFQFYTADISKSAERALSIQSTMQQALDGEQFRVDYQPQLDVHTGRITSFEALVRWESPDRGLISPGDFIPVAEETGLIHPLGAWVLRRACRDCQAWRKAGFARVGVAVNLSPLQLRGGEIVDVVTRILAETGLPADALELELTESALLEQTATVVGHLEALRRLGVRLALDDFGTGYASLSYLKRVNFDVIKIDRTFIRDIVVDAGDRAIVSAVVAIGRSFGLTVVAEGVEDAEQRELVEREGCDRMQGYLLGRPASTEKALELLRDSTRSATRRTDRAPRA